MGTELMEMDALEIKKRLWKRFIAKERMGAIAYYVYSQEESTQADIKKALLRQNLRITGTTLWRYVHDWVESGAMTISEYPSIDKRAETPISRDKAVRLTPEFEKFLQDRELRRKMILSNVVTQHG